MDVDSDYALHIPAALRQAAESAARANGTTLDQFIVAAVAEKLSALETRTYFAARARRADMAAFDRFINRDSGEPPRDDDQFPADDRRS